MNTLSHFMEAYVAANGRCKGIASCDALKACSMGAIILDVREEEFALYKQFDVPQVLYLPLSKAMQHIDKLPDDEWLIVADAAGNLSADFAAKILESGIENVCVLAGGIVDWERASMPLKKDILHEMSGSCVCQLKKRNL
jgi:rhodanese-related sulfurtransferase